MGLMSPRVFREKRLLRHVLRKFSPDAVVRTSSGNCDDLKISEMRGRMCTQTRVSQVRQIESLANTVNVVLAHASLKTGFMTGSEISEIVGEIIYCL